MDSEPRNPRRFAVALSFPGEKRNFVKAVADLLAGAFGEEQILYDHYHDAEFARVDLDVHLPSLYRIESELIVVFLCPEYPKKRWCGLEFRHIRQLIATPDAKRIMFFQFDDPGDLSPLGIVSGDGFIDIGQRELEPHEVVNRILKRLKDDTGITPKTDAVSIPIDLTRIDDKAPENLIGREDELSQLDDAWQATANRPHILTFHALGGEGKTSLVAKWATGLISKPVSGCAAAFAWSFYRQGTDEQANTSTDLFLREALVFFGDAEDRELADGPRPAAEKGKRLAALLAARRALLVLDGVEPLQYPPTSPLAGQLKDPGLSALLRQLALRNDGLCLVTTRQPIADLKNYWHSTAPQIELKRLSTAAGVELLATLGVNGTRKEREMLVEAVQGHALTLNLLGAYLREAHGGDIRQIDRVNLDEADRAEQNGHAFRCLDAYVEWLDSDADSRPALALLRLTGLFDRPADAGCWQALLRPPVLPGLTEALFTVQKRWLGLSRDYHPLKDEAVNTCLNRLAQAKLLTVNRDPAGQLASVDAHPLVRGYFAVQLRKDNPAGWRAAHERLYRHLCDTTKEKNLLSLGEMQPLFQAVAHGCLADMRQRAFEEIYWARIAQCHEALHDRPLGALQEHLNCLSSFFESWPTTPTNKLSEPAKARVIDDVGHYLFVLGYLQEGAEAIRLGLAMRERRMDWATAAKNARLLREIFLLQGGFTQAENYANPSIELADKSGNMPQQVCERAGLAQVMHYSGVYVEAESWFLDAERLQRKYSSAHEFLFGVAGFWYCEFLLDQKRTTEVIGRVPCLMAEAKRRNWLMDEAQACLIESRLSLDTGSSPQARILNQLDWAVSTLRSLGQTHHCVTALLERARCYCSHSGYDQAQADLDEAWEIAERGPMPLFQVDIHLHRARLCFTLHPTAYPWQSPAADLRAARRLIEKHGYWRRKEELEDAETALRGSAG